MNRHMLTNMNANQLQIIIGDLQAHIQCKYNPILFSF